MVYNKLFEEFLDNVKNEGTYASKEELREVSLEMLEIIKENKDATPEELVEKIIVDNIKQLQEIKNSYPIPGYTVGVNVGNVKVKLFGGNIDSAGRKMPDNALFDIASMTKFYTQIIAYNLIKEGFFLFQDKVKDLDPRFENVEDLTVGDILRFNTEFRTDGRLSDKTTIEEALSCLYEVKVISKEQYNYNDIGMMLIKELMENVAGKKYTDLVDEYITTPLGLTDTYLVVPKNKISLVTGSANQKLGMVNDPSALSVGGYSGHAGMIASNDDLMKLGKGVVDGTILPKDMLNDAYTPGIKSNRGTMGNTYTSHEKGVDVSFVDRLEPITNFAIQGSTRTQMNIGKNSISTILLNPASMTTEEALKEEAKINEARALKGQYSLSLVNHFKFNQNGKAVEYDLIDARLMVPPAETVKPITTQNAKLALRLRFLNEVIKEYDRNYTKEVKVIKKI